MNRCIFIMLFSMILLPVLSVLGLGDLNKALAAIFCWISLFCIRRIPSFNHFEKYYRRFVCFLIVYGGFEIARCVTQGEFMTLFGNPSISLWLLLPFFGLLKPYQNFFHDIRLSVLILCFGSIVLFCVDAAIEAILGTFILFLPLVWKLYHKTLSRALILIGMLTAVLWGISEEGQRYVLVMIAMAVATFVICDIQKNKKLATVYIFGCFLVPILGFVLYFKTGISIFRYIGERSGVGYSFDTRTFLYVEVFKDLASNNALLWGKGALGKYFSDYFYYLSDGSGDFYLRVAVESGFLMMLLKGGGLYVFAYIGLLLCSIYKCLKYGKNKYCLIFACILASHVFMLFIYEVPVFNLKHILYWIIIAFCNNEIFLRQCDFDVESLYGMQNCRITRI